MIEKEKNIEKRSGNRKLCERKSDDNNEMAKFNN